MKLLIFFSQLFCRHKNVYNKTEYRVYNSTFRQMNVKRYEVLITTRCTKCNKLISFEVIEKDLTKGKLMLLRKLKNAEINSIRETIK